MELDKYYYWTNNAAEDFKRDVKIADFFLKNEKHGETYFQECHSCKVRLNPLILKDKQGEKILTVPGANERDLVFYFCCSDSAAGAHKHIAESIEKSGASQFKMPLLSAKLASEIVRSLQVFDKFLFNKNLQAVAPYILKKNNEKSSSLKRARKKLAAESYEIKKNGLMPDEVKKLHIKRWGDNRKDTFFDYLNFMVKEGLAESFLVFKDSQLKSAIVSILTSNTSSFYYSIYDEAEQGLGTGTLSLAYESFMNNKSLKYFSFGRGGESYKYRYATDYKPLYEIKGFLVS